MVADLSRFRVVYKERVLNAVSIERIEYPNVDFEDGKPCRTKITPKFIGVLVINEDGNLEVIDDEAWMFQFIPIPRAKGGAG